MKARSVKSWVLIAAGMVALACVLLGILVLLAGEAKLAEVPVPGSNLTLVLTRGDRELLQYDVLASGKPVARDVALAELGDLTVDPQVSVLGDRVTITFRTSENRAPYVQFDLAACRITSHSNLSVPPPRIRNCRRK